MVFNVLIVEERDGKPKGAQHFVEASNEEEAKQKAQEKPNVLQVYVKPADNQSASAYPQK